MSVEDYISNILGYHNAADEYYQHRQPDDLVGAFAERVGQI